MGMRGGMILSYANEVLLLLLLLFLGTASLKKKEDDGDDANTDHLRILYLSLPAMGHLNPVLVMANTLGSRGHNVTIALGMDKGLTAKYKALIHSKQVGFLRFKTTVQNITHNINPNRVGLAKLGNLVAQYVKEMFEELNSTSLKDRFDLIAGDEFMMSGLFCIYSQWKIPAVVVGCTVSLFINEQPPWPWPGVLQGKASENLSFFQRIVSIIEKILFKKMLDQMIFFPQYSVLEKFCPLLDQKQLFDAPGIHLPHIVPTVIGLEYPRTLTPLTEYVGPLMSENPVPLTQDLKLKKWLEGKPDQSVVYLSMGSIFRLTQSSGEALLNGVMGTKYNLLWSLNEANRWILDNFTIDYKRVFISSWTPQFSVLSSKVIHSAILHGGYNGLSEALWNGVPVIGFPQMGEQVLSVGRLYHNRLGLHLDMESLSSNQVFEAISSIDRGDYRLRLRNLQKMFKLAGGVDRAAELMEYYAAFGYKHLVPAHAKYQWTWIEYYNADVWLFTSSIVLFYLFGIFNCLRCGLKYCCLRTKKEKSE